MGVDVTESLGSLVLNLYRASRELNVDGYQDWALDQLRRRVGFDAALWASGSYGGQGEPVVHNLVLLGRPLEMMADYERVKHADPLARRNAAQHGVVHFENSIVQNSEWSPEITAYLGKWRIAHAMAIHTLDSLTGLATALALWREVGAAPFHDDERRLLEHTVPHLIETYAVSRIIHMARAAKPRGGSLYVCAAVDRQARLQTAEQGFVRSLLAEWPDWRGPELPDELCQLVHAQDKSRYVGKRIVVRMSPMNDVLLAQARERQLADSLSERELEVARACGAGNTYKAMARLLGIAPATVRNHMSAIFAKLGVAKQSELVAILQHIE